MTEEMVEAVARAILRADGSDIQDSDKVASYHLPPARAAITAARPFILEEAAVVAEQEALPCDLGGDLILDPYTTETIATAIRNMKDAK